MRVIWGLLIVTGIAIWSVWPMLQNPSRITDIGSDGALLTWIMNQPRLFEGTNFYPYHNTLAYSDRHLLTELATRLPVKLTGNPVVAFSFAMVLGQILTMLLIYLWWTLMFKNPWAACAAAVAFGLSQIRFEYQVHLQMWSMQYWLLGILVLWRRPTTVKIYLSFALLGLQFWESPLPVYFAILVLSAKCLVLRPKMTNHHVFGALLAALIIFPLAKTYLDVSREFHFQREIREAAHNAISIDDLWGHFASLGLYILFAIAILQLKRHPEQREGSRLDSSSSTQNDIKMLSAILIISLLLAFGPALKWHGQTIKIFHLPIPMPYAPAYYLIPGFTAFRTPSRWLFVTALAMSGLIAAGLGPRKFSKLKLIALLAVAILAGTHLIHIKDMPTPDHYPTVYQWLRKQPGKIVLELPVYTWPQEAIESYRMLYGLGTGKTWVNGYSGFTPPLVFQLAQSPFVPKGVDYVIVHMDQGQVGKIEGRLVWQDETTRVYSVH